MLPKHHAFSVDDYERLYESGVLGENDRVELIRGEIYEKMIIGDAHAACVKRLNALLHARLGGKDALVSVQDPIRLPESMPEPDVVLARPREDYYASGKPSADDVLLLIEVADTSLEFDRTTKLIDYAEAGIREYWIVNLPDRCIEVHQQPQPDGTFAHRRIVQSGSLCPAALLRIVLSLAEVLPKL